MKEKPILFSTPMVQAILRDEKTQTRRIIKPQPEIRIFPCGTRKKYWTSDNPKLLHAKYIHQNYGEIGDVIWVRETFAKREFPAIGNPYIYKAEQEDGHYFGPWKPSIFMPKEACRIKLKIIDIRVERIQDISEGDAKSEGVSLHERGKHWLNYIDQSYKMTQFIYNLYSAKESYKSLWTLINGRDSWNNNPWVWVIEFKRI